MDNITISPLAPTEDRPAVAPTPAVDDTSSSIVNQPLTSVVITDENVALNVMVSFLNLAQKRGAFGLDESAKIWECIQKFIQR